MSRGPELTVIQGDKDGSTYVYHPTKKNLNSWFDGIGKDNFDGYNIIQKGQLGIECNIDSYERPFVIIVDSGKHFSPKKKGK